ncbi:MAG TPA: GNAT family protein [Solirubrobacteraceae bacterium]|jgi:RimJ/RimL family protein N-acetyltransferase
MTRIRLPGEPLVDGATALRPWRDSDLHALVEACQDPEISRWTRVPPNYGETDARAYLIQRYDMTFQGRAAPFAIVGAGDGTLAGSIALIRIEWEHRRAEVGYWLARDARGSGHATRAVRLICDWGVRALGLERIDLLAATENRPSQRVAERAGFIREAVLRSYMQARDERQDMVAYRLLAAENA